MSDPDRPLRITVPELTDEHEGAAAQIVGTHYGEGVLDKHPLSHRWVLNIPLEGDVVEPTRMLPLWNSDVLLVRTTQEIP